MTDAHITEQITHIACAKHIAHHAFIFVHEKTLTLVGHHARCVLSTMLQ